MKVRNMFLIASLTLAAPLVAAEDEDDPLEGNVKFGYLATTGNTETSSLNTSFESKYIAGDWHHVAMASAINASENKVTTAEAYETGWKSGWDFTDRDYLFGRLNWRKDRFGGFDTQFSQTIGYGRHIIDTDVHTLDGELGFGARQSEDQLGATQNETIATGALRYKWQFSDTSDFSQTLRVEVGGENTFSESVTAITARLIGALNLVASYTIRNNSDVPVGTEKTDTRTAVSLEYAF
jgi:putative salt-induced outer membrane protein